MAKNRLLLSSVAFGTSFGLSLLISHNIKTALFTGLITVPATFSGVAAVDYKQRNQQKITLTALESQIYQLKKWQAQLSQSSLAIAAEKQRTEVNLNFLKTQLSQLHTQVAEQRSYKQQLSQDLTGLEEHKSCLELKLHDLQSQLQNCEQKRGELQQYLRTIKFEKQNVEATFNFVQSELEYLHMQIAEREEQKQKAERDLVISEQSKLQLEEKLHLLQFQIQEIEKQRTELDYTFSTITQEKNITEVNLVLLQSELKQLQTQLLEQQANKDKLGQEIITLVERKLQLEQQQIEKLPAEWTDFGMQLSNSELQVLEAILKQSEPSLVIKKIAEENITMPELLIDSINEQALDTIGDLIIDPGNGYSISPKISEEYSMNVSKLLKTNDAN